MELGAEAAVALTRKAFVPLSSPTSVTLSYEESTKLSVILVCASTPAGAIGKTDRTNPIANANKHNRRIV